MVGTLTGTDNPFAVRFAAIGATISPGTSGETRSTGPVSSIGSGVADGAGVPDGAGVFTPLGDGRANAVLVAAWGELAPGNAGAELGLGAAVGPMAGRPFPVGDPAAPTAAGAGSSVWIRSQRTPTIRPLGTEVGSAAVIRKVSFVAEPAVG